MPVTRESLACNGRDRLASLNPDRNTVLSTPSALDVSKVFSTLGEFRLREILTSHEKWLRLRVVYLMDIIL